MDDTGQLCAEQSVLGWGDNYFGQATIPSGANNEVAIAAGSYHKQELNQKLEEQRAENAELKQEFRELKPLAMKFSTKGN